MLNLLAMEVREVDTHQSLASLTPGQNRRYHNNSRIAKEISGTHPCSYPHMQL